MTKDQVAELIESIKEPLSPEDFLVALATKAEEAEREACAIICDGYAENSSSPMNFAENCAEAIRARCEK